MGFVSVLGSLERLIIEEGGVDLLDFLNSLLIDWESGKLGAA